MAQGVSGRCNLRKRHSNERTRRNLTRGSGATRNSLPRPAPLHYLCYTHHNWPNSVQVLPNSARTWSNSARVLELCQHWSKSAQLWSKRLDFGCQISPTTNQWSMFRQLRSTELPEGLAAQHCIRDKLFSLISARAAQKCPTPLPYFLRRGRPCPTPSASHTPNLEHSAHAAAAPTRPKTPRQRRSWCWVSAGSSRPRRGARCARSDVPALRARCSVGRVLRVISAPFRAYASSDPEPPMPPMRRSQPCCQPFRACNLPSSARCAPPESLQARRDARPRQEVRQRASATSKRLPHIRHLRGHLRSD